VIFGLQAYLSLAAILFCTGVYGVLVHRNAVGVLVSVELMANAVNLNLVAFSRHAEGVGGQVFALIAMALTVVEVVVALAIVVLLYRTTKDIALDGAREMKG